MAHYFYQEKPAIFNRNNKEKINDEFNNYICEVKGEMEAWSQGRSRWVLYFQHQVVKTQSELQKMAWISLE